MFGFDSNRDLNHRKVLSFPSSLLAKMNADTTMWPTAYLRLPLPALNELRRRHRPSRERAWRASRSVSISLKFLPLTIFANLRRR